MSGQVLIHFRLKYSKSQCYSLMIMLFNNPYTAAGNLLLSCDAPKGLTFDADLFTGLDLSTNVDIRVRPISYLRGYNL